MDHDSTPSVNIFVTTRYLTGIDVRVGKGRYRNTHIVTVSPRFQIHNLSPFKMQIAQRCYANSFQDPEAEATHLQAFPKSTLAFHWPRLDFDQLLCVRLVQDKTNTSQWSGGFPIDDVDSFHVTGTHC